MLFKQIQKFNQKVMIFSALITGPIAVLIFLVLLIISLSNIDTRPESDFQHSGLIKSTRKFEKSYVIELQNDQTPYYFLLSDSVDFSFLDSLSKTDSAEIVVSRDNFQKIEKLVINDQSFYDKSINYNLQNNIYSTINFSVSLIIFLLITIWAYRHRKTLITQP